jgi:glycerol-3-phosphate cytidylyltransferase
MTKIIGYTSGVFDLFHIGHVNLLRSASSLCDQLIVGVTVDELVAYKFKKCVIPFEERIKIVQSCRYVDLAVPQENLDKFDAWKRLKYSKLFVGDDWYGDGTWKNYEQSLKAEGVDVIYLPYTKTTSSTLINETLNNLRDP